MGVMEIRVGRCELTEAKLLLRSPLMQFITQISQIDSLEKYSLFILVWNRSTPFPSAKPKQGDVGEF